ncbi:GNAT family N-acetyltransferase [Pelagibius marinus]|uniref:GNAT family N-acetyltransferase n=1 Tax=Pelagibius marinus TaxID=2762760 RepID=UPI001D0491AA|nr:GNAT family N-acetyltransferase [Pelagibius marinus]
MSAPRLSQTGALQTGVSQTGESLTIKPVESSADREAFIRLPWALYRDDPAWVPPLLMERRDHLNPKKNPFFQNAEARFWLALRDGRPVGRISAQVNRAHLGRHHDATGHFGMLEAEDDAETFAALLQTAEDWLREKGLKRIAGPFSLSINEESGLLVEGFQYPPSLMMGHALPYYATRLEALGYHKIKDLICYYYEAAHELPPAAAYVLRKTAAAEQLTIRPLDMRNYERDLRIIVDVFNDAWSENWGFIPMSEADLRHLAKELKPIVRPQSIAIAELKGEPAAMAISLPNVNEAISDLNGRLLPFGWAKLLWRLKVKTTKTGRVPLMGVRKAYQNSLMGATLALSVIDAIRREQTALGVIGGELSWILEDNLPMRRMIEEFGGEAYKTYRVYARELGS